MSHRCQHSSPKGQCTRPSVDGSDCCERHCNEDHRIRGYRLADESLRARFDQLSEMDSIETVQNEVHLLRALIFERIDLARTEADKIVAFQTLHPAMSTLNKMVDSLSKLRRETSEVLDKGALNKLGDSIVEILISELCDIEDYESIIDRVAARISNVIAEARNE